MVEAFRNRLHNRFIRRAAGDLHHGLERTSVKNILLVDDNKHVTDDLALVLAACIPDVSFSAAANGREAVEILRNRPVDLILTDINMPIMDGYHLIEYRNEHYPHVPLVVMTADASPEVNRRLSLLGITDCLEKPFSYETATKMFLGKLAGDSPGPANPADLAMCR